MARTVSDLLVQPLHEWGIEFIFGYPATASTACSVRSTAPKASPASSRRATRKWPPSWRRPTSSFRGGSESALPSQVPELRILQPDFTTPSSITSPCWRSWASRARSALGGHYQQELDLVSMFKDVASAYVVQASASAQVRHLIGRHRLWRRRHDLKDDAPIAADE
jgi:pyruvate dehydrogenase (quinone)